MRLRSSPPLFLQARSYAAKAFNSRPADRRKQKHGQGGVFIDDFLSSGLWGLQEGKGLVLPIPHEFGASRLMPQVIQAGVESV